MTFDHLGPDGYARWYGDENRMIYGKCAIETITIDRSINCYGQLGAQNVELKFIVEFKDSKSYTELMAVFHRCDPILVTANVFGLQRGFLCTMTQSSLVSAGPELTFVECEARAIEEGNDTSPRAILNDDEALADGFAQQVSTSDT